MNLDDHVSRLHDDLVAAAALGDDRTRATAEALAGAARTSARLMLLTALSDLAAEVSEALGDRTVQVALDGPDAVVTVRPNDAAGAAPRDPGFDDLTGDITRVTLRLVEQVKDRAEAAAAQSGQSLNSWVGQAVQGALRDQMRRYGSDNT